MDLLAFTSLDQGRWLGIPMKTVTTDAIFLEGRSWTLPDARVFFLLKYFYVSLHQKKTEVDRSLDNGDQFAERW